jgi:murein DD-endopeptidase MepM/ murein hydrolase activator NlpD
MRVGRDEDRLPEPLRSHAPTRSMRRRNRSRTDLVTKRAFVLQVFVAVALCLVGQSAPVAADDGPAVPRRAPTGPSLPQGDLIVDGFTEYANAVVTRQQAATERSDASTAAPVPAPATPTPTPPRVAPLARSSALTFSTYDELTEYAISIATTQQAQNDRLAATLARRDAAAAALAAVFDPRVRGGLLRSRAGFMDDATVQALQAQLANDAATAHDLVANGAGVRAAEAWRLPVDGEDSQDFGPTPYAFEPPLTYGGVDYPHFHTGTDLATVWGAPVVAPAAGTVVFAGTMGDGAEVVVLVHDSGLVSMYAHLDNYVFPVPVKTGDTVRAGDRIGSVGLTGITTGAHLHWSVWRNGELVDPLTLIPRS